MSSRNGYTSGYYRYYEYVSGSIACDVPTLGSILRRKPLKMGFMP